MFECSRGIYPLSGNTQHSLVAAPDVSTGITAKSELSEAKDVVMNYLKEEPQ